MLRWFEGYEVDQSLTYLARKYASSVGGSFVAGRLGGFAKSLSSSGQGDRTASLTAQSKWFLGFGYRTPVATATVDSTYRIFTGANEQLRLRLQATTATSVTITVIRGSTILATYSGTALSTNTWHYVEFYAKIDPTTGEFQVRVDEADVITLTTGQNTANNGTANADVIGWAKDAGANIEQLDDIYILDDTTSLNNTFRGDSFVEGILPTTDGATTQWTPSTGTNHAALVDDPATTPNDADFNSESTLTEIDLYNYADLVATTGAIYGIMICSDARLDVAGSRGFKPRFRTAGGTGYAFTEHSVNSVSVSQFTQIVEQNPDTVAAWVNADINGWQFGVELTT